MPLEQTREACQTPALSPSEDFQPAPHEDPAPPRNHREPPMSLSLPDVAKRWRPSLAKLDLVLGPDWDTTPNPDESACARKSWPIRLGSRTLDIAASEPGLHSLSAALIQQSNRRPKA